MHQLHNPLSTPVSTAPTRASFPVLSGLLVAAIVSAATPALAQIPSEFTNLKVLPRDIGKAELTETMRSFSFALGVRCQHCHVGEEGQPLSKFDFASDDKPTKRAARIMMKMTRSINESQLPRLARIQDRHRFGTQVTCATCHHGVPDPRPLQDLLAAEIDSGGPEAAGKRYRELRDQFYGKGTYDFAEWSLLRLTETLNEQGKSEAVRAMLVLNLEFFPESPSTHYFLGRNYLAAGDEDRALEYLRRAVELAPDNARWRKQLEELTPPAAAEQPAASPD